MRIIDSHTHVTHHLPEKLLSMADGYGYEKFCALSIPCRGNALNTLECLLLKRLAPGRAYVYGGMAYPAGLAPDGRSHARQLELLMEAGCDGWKLLESKPSIYRSLQLPLDGPVFARAFALAEEAAFPIIWHAGDPAPFWDARTAPAFAVENHWLCVGEGFPSLETIYTQVENVLARHPALRATLAHLFFTSDDRAHAERLLRSHEHVWLDVTPGSEMYRAFLDDREGWTAFFEIWRDRLVFGTDMTDDEGDMVFGSQNAIHDLVLKVLTEAKPFRIHDIEGVGLGLSAGVLEALLGGNFERRNGPAPRPVNPAGLAAYADWFFAYLPPEERKRGQQLMDALA